VAAAAGARLHTTKHTQTSLLVASVTMPIGLVYWAIAIRPQKGRAWNLRDPILDDDDR
jgi:hypothetical protein